jgi:hypothetical protein
MKPGSRFDTLIEFFFHSDLSCTFVRYIAQLCPVILTVSSRTVFFYLGKTNIYVCFCVLRDPNNNKLSLHMHQLHAHLKIVVHQ